LVAIAATAMMFSACKKDEENNVEPDPTYGITVGEIGTPKNNELIGSDSFTATWTASKSSKSDATFQYEAFLSDDGGASWNSLGKYKLNNCQLNNLEGDKLYQLKVRTYCTDADGKETTAETEPVSFVAYYKNGTIGASVLTENSITMEWRNLLPYDEVELTISECRRPSYMYFYSNEQAPVTITNGNTYTFKDLKPEQGYSIKFKIVGKDNSFNYGGTYYAMTVDGEKYLTDGEFNKYDLFEMDGKKWAIDSYQATVNCWGEENYGIKTLAYGYKTALDSDIISFIKSCGFSDSDIKNHTVDINSFDIYKGFISSQLLEYTKNGLSSNSRIFYNEDEDVEYRYNFINGDFTRTGPLEKLPEEFSYNHKYVYIKL
jgi:hypothetical protein